MVAEIYGALSAIKTAFDMAKGLESIHDATIRDRAIIELQKEILAAQATQFALVERIHALEKEVAEFETWETEKQRYELKPLGHGFAYFLKPDAQSAEASHQICANCYAHGKKSFLARVPSNTARAALGMGAVYRCPECRAEV
jgi:uncharacterized protein YgiB involved in biofilm formation